MNEREYIIEELGRIVSAALSLYTSDNSLTKRFHLDAKGELVKLPGGQMTEGTVETVRLSGPEDLAELLPKLAKNQALGFGVPRFERARVVSKARLDIEQENATEPVIARTQDHKAWPDGPGVMMLDFDPPKNGRPPLSRVQARDLTTSVWPETASAPMVICDSASSHIINVKTGEEILGQRGLRIYLFVQNAADIPRAGKALFRRMALAGHAWIEISAAGTTLERGPIDGSVWQPERLDFAAGADCVPPLKQKRPAPEVFNPDAPFLDTRTLPDLTAQESRAYRQTMDRMRRETQPEAARVRAQWLADRIDREVRAVAPDHREDAREAIRQRLSRAAETSTLPHDFILYARDGQSVTVAELLRDPDRWHGAEFGDPLDPGCYGDWRIAVAILTGAEPHVYSHAHGGQRYFLEVLDDSEFEDLGPDSEAEDPSQGKKPRSRFRALRRDDLMALEDVNWIIKSAMPSRGLGVVFGPSTVGKSFLMVDKAAHIAEGREWFGYRVKQRPVVYACLEGQHGFKRRVMAWETHHRRRYPSGVVFAPDPIDLRSEQDTAALVALVQAEAGPGAVVIIDTLNRAAPGMEENGSVDYGLILANAGKIEQAVGGFVCFVGHPGKNKDAGLRGHSSMFAGLDMVLEVEEVNRAELSFAWITRKVKDGQDGIKRHFRREVVELFEDADGDLVTSCVIVPDPEADQEGKERPKAMTSREADSLTAFKQAAMEYGEVDADGRFSSLPLEDWRTHFYQASTAEKMTVKRSAFNKTKKALVNGGWLFEDVYGNLTLIGPGADVHAEVIAAAIVEKSKANPSEPRRTQSEPGSPAEAQKANRTEPRPLRTGSGSHGPGGDFDQEREIGPNPSENINPGTFKPTGTDDVVEVEI